MSTLAELSDELLLDIFKHLDHRDVCNMASVSKQLNRISEDDCLWHNHPNIYNLIWAEEEFSTLIKNCKVNSKGLARLRAAWRAYGQSPPPINLKVPSWAIQGAYMLMTSALTKIELFHVTDSPLAPTANPFKTAMNIIKAQGFFSLFDGLIKEIFMLFYNATYIPHRYPLLDDWIVWIATSATAFFEARMIPDQSRVYRWLTGWSIFTTKQTAFRNTINRYIVRGRHYKKAAFTLGLASVPLTSFLMRALLGQDSPKATLIATIKSMATWKLWILPLTRLAVTFGRLLFGQAIGELYGQWRYNAMIKRERQKFLRLLENSRIQ